MPPPASVAFVRGFFAPEGNDATSRAVEELMGALSEAGHRVSMVEGGEGYLEAAAGRLGPLVRLRFLAGASLRVRRLRPDVVVTLDEPTGVGYVGLLAKRRRGVGWISWIVDLQEKQDLASGRPGVRTRVKQAKVWIDDAATARATRVVVLGTCMKALVAAEAPVSVIPLWQGQSWAAAPRTESSSGSPVRFLYSGHATWRQPLAPFVEAVGDAREASGLDITLLLQGGGPEFRALRASRAASTLPWLTIKEPAASADLGRTLAEADVHLVSLAGFATGTCVPSKTYAAMAAGRPVVYLGSGLGQAALDVSEADCGIVVADDDAAGLAAAVQRLAQDGPLREAMGVRAKNYYERERSLPAGLSRWLDLISGLELPRPGR